MAIELEHRFGKDSRVRDYWVATSEGFEVQLPDGRSIGTVCQVVHERDGRAVALLVESRGALGRIDRVILEAEAVEEVAPWRSTLMVRAGETPEPAFKAVALHRLAAVTVEAAEAARVRWARLHGAVTAGISRTSHSVAFATRRLAAAVRDRWPALRGTVVGGMAASARSVASATRRTAAIIRDRWPSAQASLGRVRASTIAAVIGVAAVPAGQFARLLRLLVARLATARARMTAERERPGEGARR